MASNQVILISRYIASNGRFIRTERSSQNAHRLGLKHPKVIYTSENCAYLRGSRGKPSHKYLSVTIVLHRIALSSSPIQTTTSIPPLPSTPTNPLDTRHKRNDASAHLIPPAPRRPSLDARCLLAHHRAPSTCLPEAPPNVRKLASPPFKDTNNADLPAHSTPSPAHFPFASLHHRHPHHAANPLSSTAPPSPCTTCATSS
jgi:hypothetical protein